MTEPAVEPPEPVPPAPVWCGRLAPALDRLAAAQGAWPPHRPARVARVGTVAAVVTGSAVSGADGGEAGRAAADALVDGGADLLLIGGGSPAAPALAVLAVLLDLEPVAAVGTWARPGWAELVADVREGRRRGRPHAGDLEALVEAVGAGTVAGLAGVLAQAAVRRTPVLLSGASDAWAAAVLAERRAPGTAGWLLAGCSPPGGAPGAALAELHAPVLLDLRLELPEGAELALDVLLRAVDLVGTSRA